MSLLLAYVNCKKCCGIASKISEDIEMEYACETTRPKFSDHLDLLKNKAIKGKLSLLCSRELWDARNKALGGIEDHIHDYVELAREDQLWDIKSSQEACGLALDACMECDYRQPSIIEAVSEFVENLCEEE